MLTLTNPRVARAPYPPYTAGSTPHTVSMCVFDSLVDEAKPGDRVMVTAGRAHWRVIDAIPRRRLRPVLTQEPREGLKCRRE